MNSGSYWSYREAGAFGDDYGVPDGEPVAMTECPYCHAAVPEAESVAHDVIHHDGLPRTLESHETLCEPAGRCICRLAEYLAVAEHLDGVR